MAVTLTNADIVSRLKLLADYHLKADSGSVTTAINSSLIDEPTVANAYICFVNGSNIGADRIITDFTTVNGTCTFDTLDNAITNTDEFCITRKGFLSDFEQASLAISNDFRNQGYDIDLFLTTAQLKELYIFKTLEIICGSLMNDGDDDDIYFIHYNRFKDLYTTEMAVLTADYDSNEDGEISEDEENQTASYGVMER